MRAVPFIRVVSIPFFGFSEVYNTLVPIGIRRRRVLMRRISRVILGSVAFVGLVWGLPGLKAQEPWQSDWNLFIDELSPYLARGASNSEISARFNSKVVTWQGTVNSISGTASAPAFRMDMPQRTVTLS